MGVNLPPTPTVVFVHVLSHPGTQIFAWPACCMYVPTHKLFYLAITNLKFKLSFTLFTIHALKDLLVSVMLCISMYSSISSYMWVTPVLF